MTRKLKGAFIGSALLHSARADRASAERPLSDSSGRILRVETEGKTKQPFHFGMKDESLFAFAGIWDRWKPLAGPVVESCAILTTTPNELLSDVHDRRPVILHPNHYHASLTAPGLKSHHFAHLLVPFEAALMKRFRLVHL